MNRDFFIRRYREADRDELLKLWFSGSVKAHPFIPAEFWRDYHEEVKNKYLPDSQIFVAEQDGRIAGVISLVGNYVGALFVDGKCQGQGIGSSLLAFARKTQGSICVDVYRENTSAREFYMNWGFRERREKLQPETGHILITMFSSEEYN